jgi:hypothetical protein
VVTTTACFAMTMSSSIACTSASGSAQQSRMGPDLSGSGTHLISFPVGDCPGGNVRKKALAARKIEDCAFQLVGLFIDEPETGEVITRFTGELKPQKSLTDPNNC